MQKLAIKSMMEEETLGNVIDVDVIKKRIEDNRSTLLSVIDANDLLLTELVGEDVLDEATQEEILAGPTRTEVNKRLLKWLTGSDDLSTFQMFLTKLRKYGQKHVANLLDGTQGELPLKPKDVQRIKKIMGDLAKKLDPDSGLLGTLLSSDALSEIAYEQVRAEPIKEKRAKKLLDNLLRGSDKSFEKFQEELVKNQPQVLESLQPASGDTTPHVDTLKAKFPVLKRCTDMNLLTIAFLRADDVIDDDTEDKLKSEHGLIPKVTLMQNWLMYRPAATFQAYIQVMQKNEQRHVYNLLSENASGQQPLSEKRFQRLKKKRPILMQGILNRGILLASALRGQQASDDTDFAISKTDYEAITQERKETDRNSLLIDAVLRRTDFSFECLEEALRDSNQLGMAEFLTEGEVIGAHLNTTRPDIEDAASKLWNAVILQGGLSREDQELNSSSEENQELRTCVEENRELRESFNQLKVLNLEVVATESKHSIMVYTYCKTPDDMKKYVKLLNSGQLQTIFENILNQLVKILERESFQPIEVAVTLDDEQKMLIQEFTGLDGNQADVKDLPCTSKENCKSHQKPLNFYCFDCKTVICSSCIDQDHKSHRHSDVNKTSVDLRKQLQKDLTLISSCKSKSLQLKEKIENDQTQLIKTIEESEKVILSRCEDLKQRVERFKEMVLHERATFKQQILHDFSERKRAIESYVAVFKDYEGYTKTLMERGSPSDICQSFSRLHERANKLQQLHEPVLDEAVSDKNAEWKNQMLWLTPEQVAVNPTTQLTKEIVLEHRDFLLKRMDPDFGLLDQLLAFGALTRVNVDEITMLPMGEDRNKKVLDIVITENKFKELGFAFLTSKQIHLVNYVCSNGEYKPQFGDEWPLMDEEINFLESSKAYLASLFGTCDLLPMLCSMDIIDSKQKELIASKTTPYAKSDVLLVILKRGTLSDFKNISSLLMTRQAYQVLHQEMLQPQPNPIELFRPFLEEYMDPYFGLVEELSLSAKDSRKVKNERTLQKKNGKLLDFILKHEKYRELLAALTKTNQTHIVNFLNANGAYDAKFGTDWPLTVREIHIIETSRKYLVEHLQPQPLLEKLLAAHAISTRQKDFILAKQGLHERNEALLGMLKRGSLDNYRKTVECLLSSNQIHIAQLLGQSVIQGVAQSLVNVTVRVNVNKEVAELINSFNQLIASRFIVLNENTSSPLAA